MRNNRTQIQYTHLKEEENEREKKRRVNELKWLHFISHLTFFTSKEKQDEYRRTVKKEEKREREKRFIKNRLMSNVFYSS